jgi:hypothetical protein
VARSVLVGHDHKRSKKKDRELHPKGIRLNSLTVDQACFNQIRAWPDETHSKELGYGLAPPDQRLSRFYPSLYTPRPFRRNTSRLTWAGVGGRVFPFRTNASSPFRRPS